jgi:predicted nucleic acid-binding protein
MRTVLLDSDVIIATFRNETAIIEHLDHLLEQQAKLCVSPVAYAEIFAGERSGEHDAIENFFQSVDCLPIDEAVGRKAGEYLRTFSKSSGVKITDALVAAVAHCHRSGLFTLNRKHYPMKDIELIDVRTASR